MKMVEPSYGTIQPEDIVEELGSGGGITRIVGGIGSGAFEPKPRCVRLKTLYGFSIPSCCLLVTCADTNLAPWHIHACTYAVMTLLL